MTCKDCIHYRSYMACVGCVREDYYNPENKGMENYFYFKDKLKYKCVKHDNTKYVRYLKDSVCVSCGKPISEDRQICKECENKVNEVQTK